MPKENFAKEITSTTFSLLDESGLNEGPQIALRKGSYELSKALKLCVFSKYRSRNILINGKRTSMRFDTVLWNALMDIAINEKMSLSDLMQEIKQRAESTDQINLSATTRSFIISYYRQKTRL
jgi:predicted DNA-binding ribbon-helix-helix protein